MDNISGNKKGNLRIFLGYASGVGKTYSMLKAGCIAQSGDIDVVVGFISTKSRPDTEKILAQLEQVSPLKMDDGTYELDTKEVIRRGPTLVLVDEIAHRNHFSCKNRTRYEDINEILDAGIDVYATVDAKHIESINSMMTAVTGVVVDEIIPDSIIDTAAQVELIDIKPEKLLQRFQFENLYKDKTEHERMSKIYQLDNLNAMREITLKRCADRTNMLLGYTHTNNNANDNKFIRPDQHTLVCLSSSPSNAKVIKVAARMAKAFKSKFTALYVETSSYKTMSEDNKRRLKDNMKLANQLGATIEVVYGEDIVFQIAEFARIAKVSKIVVGKSIGPRRIFFKKPTLTEKLVTQLPNLYIHIIPDNTLNTYYRTKKEHIRMKNVYNKYDVLKSIAMILISSAIGYLFWCTGMCEANISIAYMLAVVMTAVITNHQIYAVISSVICAFIFNFLFIEPIFSIVSSEKDYPLTLVLMVIAAIITGTITSKLKNQINQTSDSAYRTKILLETNQLLEALTTRDEVISVTAMQITKLLNKDIVIYVKEDDDTIAEPQIFYAGVENQDNNYLTEVEQAVAHWVFENNRLAGASTNMFDGAEGMYVAIRTGSKVYGVVGVMTGDDPVDEFERNILLSILGECALALQNIKNVKEKEEASLMAQTEKLRANLLRSISHDLRTPLTSISGNANNLYYNADKIDEKTKLLLYEDMYDDSIWLVNLVENLLSITKLEEGKLAFNMQTELLDEVISEALNHINRKKTEYNISYKSSDDFILVRMDARMIMQVVINIVNNAIKYTPPGSDIIVSAKKEGNKAIVSISDNGPGVTDDMKPFIFDMFYTGAKTIADSRRSLGLGLALCKSIVTAHDGEIEVLENKPHGAIFRFSLNIEEVELYE